MMQIFTQSSLLPELVPVVRWLDISYLAWEWKEADVVDRPTENEALKNTYKLAKLYRNSIVPMLTPIHYRAVELERYYMLTFPHWTEKDVRREIAIKMKVSENKVRAILSHAEIMFGMYVALGWNDHLPS